MKRRVFTWILITSMLLTGCADRIQPSGQKQYTATFLELFDTVTTVVGKADSEEAFLEKARMVRDSLEEYHKLFDVYNSYEGINNLKTINDNAGIQSVTVDDRIMELLLDCKVYYEMTNGRVNVAMGSVLQLWHEERTAGISDPLNAKLPPLEKLESAAEHRNMENVILDEVNHTVYLADPDMRLDVGAVAKGWTVQKVSEAAPEGLLISVGGNVVASGPKDSDGTPWVIGIENPDGGAYLHTVYLSKGSVVTSGDYQRTYVVEGKAYHHIIDPDTLYPATYWRSVSVVCEDSGLADALSTALFTLPLEAGQELAARCGAEAVWVDAQFHIYYSPGFSELIRT